jgi:HD-like signal output (HDOD) protein
MTIMGKPRPTANSDRILSTIKRIDPTSASPQFIINFIQLTSNPDAAINEIAVLVEHEPNVCAQLLKLANSVYYSRGMVITNVKRAIVYLGLNTVKKLVINAGEEKKKPRKKRRKR